MEVNRSNPADRQHQAPQGVSEASLGISAFPAQMGAVVWVSSANSVQSGDMRWVLSPESWVSESCQDFPTHEILQWMVLL